MAGIPMYHGITTSGDVAAHMARNQMDEINTEKAQMDLDSIKREINNFSKLTQAQKQSQVPAGFNQGQAVPAQPTPIPAAYNQAQPTTVSSNGTPMPSFMTSEAPQGQAQNATPMPAFMTGTPNQSVPAATEQQPQAQAPVPTPTTGTPATTTGNPPAPVAAPAQDTNPVAPAGLSPTAPAPKTVPDHINETGQAADSAYKNVQLAYQLADRARENGDLLSWERGVKRADSLKMTMLDSQIKHYTAQEKYMDLVAGEAGAYKDMVKADPTNKELSDNSWARMILSLKTKGLDPGGLSAITDPKQRLELANQTYGAALGGKERLRLEIANNHNAMTTQIAANKLANDQAKLALANRIQAFNQEKFNATNATNILKDSTTYVNNLRSELEKARQTYGPDKAFDPADKAAREAIIADYTAKIKEAESNHERLVSQIRSKAKASNVQYKDGDLGSSDDTTNEGSNNMLNTHRTQALNVIANIQKGNLEDSIKQTQIAAVKAEFTKMYPNESLDAATTSMSKKQELENKLAIVKEKKAGPLGALDSSLYAIGSGIAATGRGIKKLDPRASASKEALDREEEAILNELKTIK